MKNLLVSVFALFILAQGECTMLPPLPFYTQGGVEVVTTVELCNVSNESGSITLTGPHVWSVLNYTWGLCVEDESCSPEMEPSLEIQDGDGWLMRFVFDRKTI